MSKWFKHWSEFRNNKMCAFFFPYAGAGASAFSLMVKSLHPYIHPIGVQLPGREERIDETPLNNLDLIVNHLYDAIQSYAHIPMVFFGYSNGALIAYELAFKLQQNNLPIKHMFIAAKKAPHLPKLNPPIHQLPEHDFIKQLRNHYYLPEAVINNEKLMSILIPRMRADLTISEKYVTNPDKKLCVNHSCFSGDQDKNATLSDLQAWSDLINGLQKTQVFKGGHMFIKDNPEQLTQAVNATLASAFDN